MSTSLSTGFSVSIDPGGLRFSAAHFITYGGSCENLHGHNFHVRIDAHGDNSDDELVVDFVLLTRLAQAACDQLHDKVLLPGKSPVVQQTGENGLVHVRSYDKYFVFPEDNICVLPIANTTAEMLAWHVGEQLLATLRETTDISNLAILEIAVEEADRQWGISRRVLRDDR